MGREQILTVIVEFLQKRGDLPKGKKESLNYRYLESGHVDSFGIVQLIMSLEEEFNIESLQESLRDIGLVVTVGDLVEAVYQRIKAKP